MLISTVDKARGKRHIMRVVEPAVLALGFTKHPRGEFTRIDHDGSQWRLLFDMPISAPVYRIHPSVTPVGGSPVLGPVAGDYEAPNTPNGTRYNFRFHLATETYDRCADNLLRWVHDVAMPWFHSSPTASWRNPNLPSSRTA